MSSKQKAAMPQFDGNLRGVLFDLDGTLCDSDPIHHAVFEELFVNHGVINAGECLTKEMFAEHIAGRTNKDIFGHFFPSKSEAERRELWELKEVKFREMAATKLKRMGGFEALMNRVDSTGVAKVVVTNAPRENAEFMLRTLNLDTWFGKFLVIGSECSRGKPHPEPYLKGLRLIGVEDPATCVAFEDSPAGATAAVAANIPTVGILSSQPASAMEALGVSITVADFADLKLIDAIGI